MKRVYAEIGFGNETFLSTEIEEGDKEYRIPISKLMPYPWPEKLQDE